MVQLSFTNGYFDLLWILLGREKFTLPPVLQCTFTILSILSMHTLYRLYSIVCTMPSVYIVLFVHNIIIGSKYTLNGDRYGQFVVCLYNLLFITNFNVSQPRR